MDKSPLLWAVGLVTALLTAFYMSRQVFMVFFGEARWDEAGRARLPEPPAPRAVGAAVTTPQPSDGHHDATAAHARTSRRG